MNKPDPPREALRQSLAQLHTQLAATPRVDESARRLLRQVLADIERLLGAYGSAEAAADPAVARTAVSAPQRLRALAVEFDARHPPQAGSLRQFVDLLGGDGL